MFPQLGFLEVLVILAIGLLLFGASSLPSVGRALGQTIVEFKRSLSGNNDSDEKK